MEQSGKFRVLIVDDTSTNVLILKKTLVNAGYAVLSADNGPSGREIAEREIPDLILLDIMMPDEDGFETIAKLKATPPTASIPVIFLTAISDVEAKIKGFELGAVDFITKPFHPAEIRARTSLHIKLSIATNALIKSQADKLKQIESAQHSMLLQPQDMPDARFDVFFSSLAEAGGDYYDVLRITDNVAGYFLSDVSGHDIATSFATSAIKALLKQNCSPIYSPVESMQLINRILIDVLPDGKYLTANYLTIDRKLLTASLIGMGHPPAIHVPAQGGSAKLLEAENDVLGIFQDAYYQAQDFPVAAGDRIYLYSDGLLENKSGDKIWTNGVDDLAAFLASLPKGIPLAESIQAVKAHCKVGEGVPSDDIVILATEI